MPEGAPQVNPSELNDELSLFLEQCIFSVYIIVSVPYMAGASLIAGLEYGMDRWNGKWNGTVIIHNYN